MNENAGLISRIFLCCTVNFEGVFAEAAIRNEQRHTRGFLFKKILTISIAAFSFSLFDYDIIIQYIFIKINWCRGGLDMEARNLTRKFFFFPFGIFAFF